MVVVRVVGGCLRKAAQQARTGSFVLCIATGNGILVDSVLVEKERVPMLERWVFDRRRRRSGGVVVRSVVG